MRHKHASLVNRVVSTAKNFALASPIILVATPCSAQVSGETIYEDQSKLIRAPQAYTRLGDELFGDKVNLYTGALEFIQTDVSLPGNSQLPVAVGRRLVVGQVPANGTLFGNWDLDIPHLHGVFAKSKGWASSVTGSEYARCTNFFAPPTVTGSYGSTSEWSGNEYWRGSFLYIPGQGDQEMLRRSSGFTLAPHGASPATYPIVTRNKWAFLCLPTLDPANGERGEGFVAVSPDGTEYQFDWLVTRQLSTLTKPFSEALESTTSRDIPLPHVKDGASLARVEVWILPTRITDRHGNSVTYRYDNTNKWQLTSIVGTETSGNSRTISLRYVTPGSTASNLVESVSDGVRTWRYSYDSGALTAVTLPDSSTWQLGGLGSLLRNVQYKTSGTCDDPGHLTTPPLTGWPSHQSGARAEFTLTPTRHGRAGVAKNCKNFNENTRSLAVTPMVFDTLAITKKTITGPGLRPMEWTTSYPAPAPSWAPCNDCSTTKVVEVTDPANNRTRYTFGTLFLETEGQLQQTDVLDESGTVIRSTYLHYAEPRQPFGYSQQRRGDGAMAGRVLETDRRQISQQGVDFVWQAFVFDPDFGLPTTIVRSNSEGINRGETTRYEHNLDKWVLGQVQEATEIGTGKVMVRNRYNPATANLESVSKFGHLEQSMTYHPDGTLATRKDGLNQATTYEDYKRGIPRKVTFADGSWESAAVDDIGSIRSMTRQISAAGETATTGFAYDAMGRLAGITHPADDVVHWNPTAIQFHQVWEQEYDLPAGHWRQIVTAGSAIEVNYFDALWRPVYTDRWDQADRAGTGRFVERQYDFKGRTIYESYPRRNYWETSTGVHQQHDALGRPTLRTTDSELGQLYDGYTYGEGFRKWYVDAKQHSMLYTYQVFDEPNENTISTISMPEDVFVEIRRDQFGKPLAITRSGQGKTAMRSYVYDGNERLCKTIEPEIGATIQDYDAANNVTWRAIGLNLLSTNSCDTATVPAAKKTSYRYDARNRLWATTYGDGSPGITRTYTTDGLAETIASSGTEWTYRYNKRRLNTSESLVYGGVTYTIGHIYDPNGSLAELTYPGNLTVGYNPNALGEPRQVGPYASGVSYHTNGAARGFTYGNGIVRSMSQNLRGLPEWSIDAGVLRDNYQYDKNGNVGLIADWQEGITNRILDYDGLDRLRLARAPSLWGDAWYGYDALDNLVSTQITGGGTARTVTNTFDPTTNRLTGISNSSGAGYGFDYQYDSQGNIAKRGTQRFEFDQANRLKSATDKGTYVYDGLGRRVSTVGSDGVNRISVYSQEGKLMYMGVAGLPLESGHKYIYLHNHMIAEVVANGGVNYMHADGLGSPVAVTDYQRNIISQTRYEPYGATADGTAGTIGFGGHVNAGDLGLVYMQQRFYDPVAGRFLSIDPVTTDADTGDGFNRYSYANNSPYKFVDPDGRNPIAVGIVGGGAVLLIGAWKYATDPQARAVINRMVAATVSSGSGNKATPSVGQGCIYCVSGDKTSSGKDYIGSTDDLDNRSKDSSDGRDRRGADVIDIYQIGDREERRRKEQQALNDKGGLSETDNRRNEIRETKWGEKGVKPPPPKPPEPKSPEPARN